MPIFVSYATPSGPAYGLVIDGVIHAWAGDPFTAPDVPPGPALDLPEAPRLLPPVRPSKIVCVGRNYAAHAAEHHAEVPAEPMLFFKPPSALIGSGAPIQLPPGAGRVEHEAELAVVIGRAARRVPREEALGVVLGYTCANDVSARDYQQKDGQWGRAKGFDTFCPLGPWIVSGLDPSARAIRCLVNGEVRQASHTGDMVFDVPALIAFISQIMTLQPGDVILTGTPSGVSPLYPGDVVRVEIEGIGALENPVEALA